MIIKIVPSLALTYVPRIYEFKFLTPFQVVLAVSYHAEILQQEMDLEAARLGIKITFAHEKEPLGKNRRKIFFRINSK